MADTHLTRLLNREFSLKANLLANFAGNGLVAIVSIIALPLYLPLIGIEAFGLIGFFTVFQSLLSVLDLGLGITITRQLAIRTRGQGFESESRDLVRTSEAVYWGMGIVIATISAAATPVLVDFVNPQNLSKETLRDCFLLMSASLALQFPIGLYSSGLLGLQRQVLVSVVSLISAILRSLGVLAVLHSVSASPQAFFLWQVVVGGVHTAALAGALWKALPNSGRRARFRSETLRRTWRFTAGIGAISIVSVLVLQMDKVVLARILPLDSFGYYAIATVVSGSLHRLVQPVFQAYFPKLAQLASEEKSWSLVEIYHQGCQVIAVVLLPVSTVIVFFSREIMTLWQRNDVTVGMTYMTVSLLVVGSAMNGLIFIPYALQLAYGWTRLHLFALSTAVVVSIPLTTVLGLRFGSIGAASVWIIINAGFLIAYIPLMHRRLLKGETWNWYFHDVFKLAFAATTTAVVCRLAFVETSSYLLTALQLAVTVTLVTVSTGLASDRIRRWTLKWFSRS